MNNFTLLEPQKPHFKTLLDSIFLNGVAIDHSDTGTGKTYVASAIAKTLNTSVIVICPKIVIPVWKKVFKSFGVEPFLIINYEKICRGNTEYLKYNKKEYFKKKNWESKGISIHFPKNSLVIFDEVHKCRGRDSLHSELLIACKNHGYKILKLSASAAMTVLDMKAFGYSSNLHVGGNFAKFCKEYGAENDGYGGLKVDKSSMEVITGMERIHDNLFNIQKISSRMRTTDFRGIFPDNRVIAECYDMGDNTNKIQGIYDLMQQEIDMLEERSANYSAHVFAIMMKARRQTEMLKVPSMVEMMSDLYDEGLSPVLFVSFSDTIDAVAKRLPYPDLISKIVGGQGDVFRENEIQLFQSDKKRFMLANLRAGSAGVSLHDLNGNYPRHTIISPSFSAVDVLQALGRIPRQGGLTPCLQKILFASGTIEEHAWDRVQFKLNNLDTLNGHGELPTICDEDFMAGINF